ncbi:elongation factor G [Thermosediminibacter litoriperuensis]|uniref:Elongation factor G n=1 Tax=Thermosediminibacter litoriperuensis TaxID=291989 RepID=A0A5S5AF19_9FIRM|nr:elongation factor G [Thermosediminibacter litoriperuensis]TYP48162.1 elongation factor G [Thermosediminibacter litoriperuensis]
MKNYGSDRIKNIGLFAHSGAGKTSLAEAMLFTSGAIDRLGKIDEGNTTCDYDPEEIKRRISISTSLAPLEWKDYKINILDTPGYFDFVGEVKSALRVVDGAVIVTCAVSGVEVGTEQAFKFTEEHGLPCIFFVNKMDRENANFYKVLEKIREFFGQRAIPFQLPIGQEANFKGVVDIVHQKAYAFDGKSVKETPVPDDLKGDMENYRFMIMEAAAEADDDLLAKYLEGEELTGEEIEKGLKIGVKTGRIYPIVCGSSLANKGIQLLLDTICCYMPSAVEGKAEVGKNPRTGSEEKRECSSGEPFSAIVFKTMADPFVGRLNLFKVCSGVLRPDTMVYNATRGVAEKIGHIYFMRGRKQENAEAAVAGDIVAVAKLQNTYTNDTLCDKDHPILLNTIDFPEPVISFAVEPKSKGDEDKISSGLARLTEEDMTFKVAKNNETGQLLVSGMGEIHLEVLAGKLASKFGSEVVLSVPKVPYRETIRGTAKVEGKYKKQTGGRGQYGHVWIEFSPIKSEEDFEFEEKIFGGAVPKQYIPAVEKGIREAMKEGVLAGYPVVGFKAVLYDGSFHPVDSSELAFKIAASMAFKKGISQAKPVLLEPIYELDVVVPEHYMGDIIGDLNKRRGRIMGMELKDGLQHIKAQAPLAEIFRYATDLRSMTQGRGWFSATFSHYEEVPAQIAEKIIAESGKKPVEEE